MASAATGASRIGYVPICATRIATVTVDKCHFPVIDYIAFGKHLVPLLSEGQLLDWSN